MEITNLTEVVVGDLIALLIWITCEPQLLTSSVLYRDHSQLVYILYFLSSTDSENFIFQTIATLKEPLVTRVIYSYRKSSIVILPRNWPRDYTNYLEYLAVELLDKSNEIDIGNINLVSKFPRGQAVAAF